MGDVNNKTSDDSALFRKAMADVVQYPEARHVRYDSISKLTGKTHNKSSRNLESAASITLDKTHADFLEFARHGISKRTFQRLKRGGYPIDDTLDLHGQTQDQAAHSIAHFLYHPIDSGNTCVLIIHGKGLRSDVPGGVLKHFTADWLKQQAVVRAFCTTVPRDGGGGAVYVLLG